MIFLRFDISNFYYCKMFDGGFHTKKVTFSLLMVPSIQRSWLFLRSPKMVDSSSALLPEHVCLFKRKNLVSVSVIFKLLLLADCGIAGIITAPARPAKRRVVVLVGAIVVRL